MFGCNSRGRSTGYPSLEVTECQIKKQCWVILQDESQYSQYRQSSKGRLLFSSYSLVQYLQQSWAKNGFNLLRKTWLMYKGMWCEKSLFKTCFYKCHQTIWGYCSNQVNSDWKRLQQLFSSSDSFLDYLMNRLVFRLSENTEISQFLMSSNCLFFLSYPI